MAKKGTTDFNPNLTSLKTNNIFGLPFTPAKSRLVFIPVPWDVTVSNYQGTSEGPQNIFDSSFQIDLYDTFATDEWKRGMAMEKIDPKIVARNKRFRKKSSEYIKFLENGGNIEKDKRFLKLLDEVNVACEELSQLIELKSHMHLEQGRIPIVIGGDHSVSFGLLKALSKRQPGFAILQIDAHADLRENYQGFTFSHASAMSNAKKLRGVKKIVQVGVRELSYDEYNQIKKSTKTLVTFFDRDVQNRMLEGEPWAKICNDIIDELPETVYISLDIDGLQP
ncbi:MAG: agmatinase, partial [Candidatus Moranbacteria bacterium]|nr:agmatinase [Candidatus Moranbacteria bacterium]